MKNTQNKKNHDQLTLLRKRIEQNFADFKAEILMLDDEKLFELAHRIVAVTDTYEQIMDEDADYMDEDDVAFLLKYYNPLEMVADYLQEWQSDYPVEIDGALIGLFNDDKFEDKYLTMEFAEELADKYGDDVRMKTALLFEAVEAGKRYIGLLKLTANDVEAFDCDDNAAFCESLGVDEHGIFIQEGDEEGCF